jgi:hypothetical protein
MAAPPNAAAEREARLAAALRENLRKRKAQARARDEAARPGPEQPEAETGEQPKDKGGP